MTAPLASQHRRAFALAGDAVFTLVGRAQRFTYRVRLAPEGPGFAGRPPTWFVEVLVGPQNTTDYQYLGTIRQMADPSVQYRHHYTHGLKSRIGTDAPSAVAFAWAWPRLERLDELGAQFWHCGRCGRCGRPLTDPSSIASGLGPICAGRQAA
jgi:hypothetical protein